MVYNEKLAVALKVAGKILRESDDTVYLPFGSEFSVTVKNLSTRRVKVKIDIDGTCTSDDTWFVIGPNSSTEIERFVKNGNLQSGNRFKFIERTSEIEEHRGIRIDDGLIRVSYQFEKEKIEVPEIHRYPVYEPYYVGRPWYQPYYPKSPFWDNQINYGGAYGTAIGASGGASFTASNSVNVSAANFSKSAVPTRALRSNSLTRSNDAGITVPGSKSDQQFTTSGWFATESKTHVLILKLKGEIGDQIVEKPVEVVRENKCSTCGRANKYSANYCHKCGTSLNVA